MDAKLSTEYRIGGSAEGPDGYTAEWLADDSLKSWWAIVRWNWHFRHWRALGMNARDLFTKVIRRRLRWQRS
jgi:hypothetical protein